MSEQKNTMSPALTKEWDSYKVILSQKKEKWESLTIKGIDDREGYDAVHIERMEVREIRIKIQKAFKTDRDELNIFVKANLAKEKKILAYLTPFETMLHDKEKVIDDEKKRIKDELIALENARIQKRVDLLATYGFVIDFERAKNLTDDEFKNELNHAVQIHTAEQERLRLEQEAANKKEKERLDAIAKQEEENAITAKANELIAEKQKEDQQKIDKENERLKLIAEGLAKQTFKNRSAQLHNLGMKFDGSKFLFHEFVLTEEQIKGLDDLQWDIVVNDFTPKIAQKKKEMEAELIAKIEADNKEKERLENLEKLKNERIRKLIHAGFEFDGNNYFVSDWKRLDPSSLTSYNDHDFEIIIDTGSKEVKRLKEKAENDKILADQKEKQRLNALMSEKERSIKWIDNLFENVKYKDNISDGQIGLLIGSTQTELCKILNETKEKLNSLK